MRGDRPARSTTPSSARASASAEATADETERFAPAVAKAMAGRQGKLSPAISLARVWRWLTEDSGGGSRSGDF